MAKAARLLELLQILRRHRRPVSGPVLAEQLGVSVRTLYRDIATLQGQGAAIDGAPGLGYVLRPGFLLPPLMLRDEEIEALVLGMRWVAKRGDDRLAQAAADALAKVAAVLPEDLRDQLADVGLLIGAISAPSAGAVDLAILREALRREMKVNLGYGDRDGSRTQRIVWPVALGYFDDVLMLAAWCELRGDFRHFRTDRMISLELTGQSLPRRRRSLLRQWRETEGIAAQLQSY